MVGPLYARYIPPEPCNDPQSTPQSRATSTFGTSQSKKRKSTSLHGHFVDARSDKTCIDAKVPLTVEPAEVDVTHNQRDKGNGERADAGEEAKQKEDVNGYDPNVRQTEASRVRAGTCESALKPTDGIQQEDKKSRKKKKKKENNAVEEFTQACEVDSLNGNNQYEPLHSKQKRRKKDKLRFEDIEAQSEIVAYDLDNSTSKADFDGYKGQLPESRHEDKPVPSEPTLSQNTMVNGRERKEKKRKKSEKSTADQALPESPADARPSEKHKRIKSKFEKSMKVKQETQANEGESAKSKQVDLPKNLSDESEVHNLMPIPLPEAKPDTAQFSYSSALPSWLSQPSTIPSHSNATFRDLQVDVDLTAKLEQKDYVTALPVQAGVLQLLLPTEKQHQGDVCISAATGSGKTLAYILPIVQSLRGATFSKLRAIIIVPTRELVSQVREVAELCASGTDLKVGTAVGNHTLKSEQDTLVRSWQQWDPAGYETEQKRKSRARAAFENGDDSDFSLDEYDPLKCDDWDITYNHVCRYDSKVDILIATPGRLVEHVCHTNGFSLSSLQWLVIDEADRLLDESFQDWAETVIRATESTCSNKFNPFAGDPYLSGIFFDNMPLGPRKVVLSATMSRDLEKLASLKLTNPKFVVIEGADGRSKQHDQGEAVHHPASGNLYLPPGLEEYGVPIEHGSDKPLYVSKLVEQILNQGPVEASGKKIVSPPAAVPRSQAGTPSSSGNEDSEPDASSSSSSSISSQPSSPMSAASSSAPPSSPEPIPLYTSPPQKQPSNHAPVSSPTPTILMFTSTTESATRLMHLLSHLLPTPTPTLATLTKSTPRPTANTLLTRLRTGKLQILISTDRASRGLDVPTLTHVISYDVPRSVEEYTHRVGRTARAGRKGEAWTLVEGREGGWFWNVVAKGKSADEGEESVARIERGGGKVKKVRLGKMLGMDEGLRGRYADALRKLGEDVRGKGGGEED